jgi:hypothetical protein
VEIHNGLMDIQGRKLLGNRVQPTMAEAEESGNTWA